MDTLAMHRMLTGDKLTSEQADAIIKVIEGGVVTKQDPTLVQQDLKQDLALAGQNLKREMSLLEVRLAGRIERLETKVDLILGGVVPAVLAPAIARLPVG